MEVYINRGKKALLGVRSVQVFLTTVVVALKATMLSGAITALAILNTRSQIQPYSRYSSGYSSAYSSAYSSGYPQHRVTYSSWGDAAAQGMRSSSSAFKSAVNPGVSQAVDGATTYVVIYAILLLFATLSLVLSIIWLVFTANPAARARSCGGSRPSCMNLCCDIAWDAVFVLFWFINNCISAWVLSSTRQGATQGATASLGIAALLFSIFLTGLFIASAVLSSRLAMASKVLTLPQTHCPSTQKGVYGQAPYPPAMTQGSAAAPSKGLGSGKPHAAFAVGRGGQTRPHGGHHRSWFEAISESTCGVSGDDQNNSSSFWATTHDSGYNETAGSSWFGSSDNCSSSWFGSSDPCSSSGFGSSDQCTGGGFSSSDNCGCSSSCE